MKAATEVQNISSPEQVEKYGNHYAERITLLWFVGLKYTHFQEKNLQYLYQNVCAGFNDKINFSQVNLKKTVMAFVVNKSKSLSKRMKIFEYFDNIYIFFFVQKVQFEKPFFHNKLAQMLANSCFIHYATSALPCLLTQFISIMFLLFLQFFTFSKSAYIENYGVK